MLKDNKLKGIETIKMLGSSMLIGIFIVTVGIFITGYVTMNHITSNAYSEDILIEKDKYIQNIVSYDDNLSQFAVGKRVSELDKLSLEKLKTIERKGIKIIINADDGSYIDEKNRTIYISIKSSNEGLTIDFINNLLEHL